VPAALGREQQSILAGLGVLEQMFADQRQEVRRDRNVTDPGV